MSFRTAFALAIIAGSSLLGTAASAQPLTVNTDRVTVRIDPNGGVQIRTTGNDVSAADLLEGRRLPLANSLPNNLVNQRLSTACQQVTQRVQSQHQTRQVGGDRIYSQSYSSTQVCN
jgi:hypothetical protein